MDYFNRFINSLMGRQQLVDDDQTSIRLIHVNHSEFNVQYPKNKVTNTKYTPLTFIPLNLKEQFSRFMNIYFLMIACLQLIPTITPVSPITTWAPLIVIFTISAIKEALDDFSRYRMDVQSNRKRFTVIRDGIKVTGMKSKHIMVGDIVMVENLNEIPCDLILLQSVPLINEGGEQMSEKNVCFVQTANIDGESDFKTKRVIPGIGILDEDKMMSINAQIECPTPNKFIYQFDAIIRIGETVTSISPEQLLLQGSTLVNTQNIYGIAVYTGNQTKLSMNKEKPKQKLTKLDKYIDKTSRMIFLSQLFIVIVLGIIGDVISESWFSDQDYLQLGSIKSNWFQFLVIPLRMLLLMSFMIPISLKVSLDILKYTSSCFIAWDLKMYDSEQQQPAVASNTGISEDLGQIQYVFSDKTGTLTKNKMELKYCFIEGRHYKLSDSQNLDGNGESSAKSSQYQNFWRSLSLCHSISPIKQDDHVVYKGPSPDEEALVTAASKQNFKFLHKKRDILSIEVLGQAEQYKLLNVLEFSSDRKRMSVIVQIKNQIILFSKGADEVILPRCTTIPQDAKLNLEKFSNQGLRTLCVTMKLITNDQYEGWKKELTSAQNSLKDRNSKVNAAYEVIERQLTFLGICAIEDELQDEVAETISMLRRAGIKIWMLTGDKRETAIQIGVSCNLISSLRGSRLYSIKGSQGLTDLRNQLVHYLEDSSANRVSGKLSSRLQNYVQSPDVEGKLNFQTDEESYSIVVDGETLQQILHSIDLKKLFMDLCLSASTVICCRVTPSQKSTVVHLIKDKGYNTLAIGDGGNDVSMIQNANVGVGILGKEGLQASRAADYSLSQFKYLERLLLIHGRYSYHRTSYLALYCFYKSIFIGILQASYEFSCGFSGTSLLTTFALTSYNVVFTAFPVLFYCLDKDVSEELVYSNTNLYDSYYSGKKYSYILFLKWALRAVYHSILTFIFTVLIFQNLIDPEVFGGSGYLSMGMLAYSAGILIQTGTMLIETNSFTIYNFIAIFGSLIGFFGIAAWMNTIPSIEIFGVMDMLYQNPSYWYSLLLVFTCSVIPIITYKLYQIIYYPTLVNQLKLRCKNQQVDIELSKSQESLPLQAEDE